MTIMRAYLNHRTSCVTMQANKPLYISTFCVGERHIDNYLYAFKKMATNGGRDEDEVVSTCVQFALTKIEGLPRLLGLLCSFSQLFLLFMEERVVR